MPVPLIVIGAVLALLVLLLLLRVRITLRLKESVSAELAILCFKIRLYPRKKKTKIYSKKRMARIQKRKARKAAKKALRKSEHKPQEGDEEKRTLREKLRFLRALSAMLIRSTHKHLRLHAARLHIRVATGDAASTAIAYGAVSASLAYLLAGLDKVTRLKAQPPDVAVTADFLGERSSADVKLLFSLRLWGAIAIGIALVISHLRNKRQVKKARRTKNITPRKGA